MVINFDANYIMKFKYIVIIIIIFSYFSNSFISKLCKNKESLLICLKSLDNDELTVMVNGMPGLMALETAKSCIDNGLQVATIGFTGEKTVDSNFVVQGLKRSVTVELIKGPGIIGNNANEQIKKLKSKHNNLIIIDYTHPSAVLNNIECYTNSKCDFVMGTTGGDLSKIKEIFEKGLNNAVIAPNMAKQIVAMQAGLLEISKRYPNSFKNYNLKVFLC
jgi:4-hydroxy-tetrahydrodipicolinate reductase